MEIYKGGNMIKFIKWILRIKPKKPNSMRYVWVHIKEE